MISTLISQFENAPVYAAIAAAVAVAGSSVWFWFWIREDDHPEPFRLIALACIAGMIIVPFVVPVQQLGYELYISRPPIMVLSWALVEELYKYAAALILILWRRDVDEPIDYVIYMIMIGVGFATAENMLYLFRTLIDVGGSAAIGAELLKVGALRFAGASLVHIVSSATIGVAMAFTFTRPQHIRLIAGLIGLSTATLLHSLFNLTIMSTSQQTSSASHGTGIVFLGVWAGVIALLLVIERIKRIRT